MQRRARIVSQPTSARGFTLVEVLVALVVFSIMSAASVYTLRLSVEARDQVSAAQEKTRSIDLMRTVMKQDIFQMIARPVRDEFGALNEQWFYGGSAHPRSMQTNNDRLLFSFARTGWINPGFEAPRSSLQYITYFTRGDKLYRRVRPYLDDARGQGDIDRLVLDGFQSIDVKFMRGESGGKFDWVSDWPTGVSANNPRVIVLTLRQAQSDALELWFYVGAISE